MNREQLAHVLRAAAQIVDDPDILVIGSQAILGTFDPDDGKADEVDGAIGELSSFHQQFGYYGQGVSVTTAVLPKGWRDRVVPFNRADADPSAAVCLDAHDLVVSKLVAGREKDLSFAAALIRERLVDVDTLLERAGTIDRPDGVRERVRDHIRRCASGRSAGP